MTDKQQPNDYVSANLAAWEEVAPIHAEHNQVRLLEAFRNPDFYCLDDTATARLDALGVQGKDVAQVACNNGIELITIKRMGAARCTGFDGAEGFMQQGRDLAKAVGEDVEFVCCDANAIPQAYHGCFDLVVITIGVLSWMPDIDGFFAGVSELLKPGGAVFIYEHHPVLEMMEPGAADDPVAWELSYFATEPYVDHNGLDYYGGTDYGAKPNMSFMHKMSDIVMATVKAGLSIEHFEELPQHISNTWWNVEKAGIGLPMSYTMVVRKAG